MKEKFRNRMLQYLSSEGDAMVFTEDLKNMVYLAEDNPEDLDICIRMMKRFNQQNKELRFGTFVFGPVAMRLFYHLNKPDAVLNCLKDKELEGFFDQISSYHIAMNLLFINERHQDVLDIYDMLRNKQLYGTRYPRDCVVLALGSCYKLNTPESYKYCINLLKLAREVGANILRKGITFASALALAQNDPKMAMEILALTPTLNFVTVKNLRLMALSELDRLDDVFSALRSIVDQDIPMQMKTEGEITQDTIDKIEESIKRQGDKEIAHIFEQIHRALRDNNHISKSSLDELLCTPVLPKTTTKDFSGASSAMSRRPAFGRIVPLSNPPRSSSAFSLRQRQSLLDSDE